MAARGAFILFEGVDRCGKTTQATRLVSRLNDSGKKTVFMRFPDRTTQIGKMIDSYLTNKCELDDHVVHLLFSANRWELSSALRRHIEEGTNVVVDRYSYSGVAFSAAKPGMGVSWCAQPERGLPRPDALLFLNLTTADAQNRGEWGEERYEKEDFQDRVRENYKKMRMGDETQWYDVDARGSIEEVEERVQPLVDQTFEKVQGTALGSLWVSDSAVPTDSLM